MLSALSNLVSLKQSFGAKLLQTVESVETLLDGDTTMDRHEDASLHKANVLKQLLVESQFQHLKAFRDCEKLIQDKDFELSRLREQVASLGRAGIDVTDTTGVATSKPISNGFPGTPEKRLEHHEFATPGLLDRSTSNLTPNSESSSSSECFFNGEASEKFEGEIRKCLAEKFEAEVASRLHKENSEALALQVETLKRHIMAQEAQISKLTNVVSLHEKNFSGQTNAIDSLAGEYSALSRELAETAESLKNSQDENESLRKEIKDQQNQISMLLIDNSEEKGSLCSPAAKRSRSYQKLIKKLEKNQNNELKNLNSKFQELSMGSESVSIDEEIDILRSDLRQKSLLLSKAQKEIQNMKQEIIRFAKIEEENIQSKEEILRLDEEKRLLEEKKADIMKREAETKQKLELECERFQSLYKKEWNLRRSVHNELCTLRGNIRVICRIRPTTPGVDASEAAITCLRETELMVKGQDSSLKTYDFERVFGPDSTQQEVFNDVEPLVTSVLDGYNVSVFAYGQTGSGKTYTMDGSVEDPGVIPRTLQLLFERISKAEDTSVSITLSIVEIYNEKILDLLVDDRDNAAKVDIKLGSTGDFELDGVKKFQCQTFDEALSLLELSRKSRSVGSHNLNEHSSRSHLVLKIDVSVKNSVSGALLNGSLSMIDLAGSERLAKTGAEGKVLKEAQSINKSLSALGDVIFALQDKKKKHIPYRNSKLTHLMQSALGGNGKVLMFLNISPEASNCAESVCSLKFGDRCKNVELGRARKKGENEDVLKYRKVIDDLQAQVASIQRLNSGLSSPSIRNRSDKTPKSSKTGAVSK